MPHSILKPYTAKQKESGTMYQTKHNLSLEGLKSGKLRLQASICEAEVQSINFILFLIFLIFRIVLISRIVLIGLINQIFLIDKTIIIKKAAREASMKAIVQFAALCLEVS